MNEVVDAFDRFLAAASRRGGSPAFDAAADLARRARERFGGDTLVVALAGGTGSGKSAVANAVAGCPLLLSGPLRPTTTRPAALVPDPPEPGLVAHLRHLGIDDIRPAAALAGVALIDLPDTDSVIAGNRRLAETVLPGVDIVVWVLDPEKYHDRSYTGLTDPARADRCLFVLNQLDRIPAPQREPLLADLRAILAAEGFTRARVVGMAADPAFGPPEGVEELLAALGPGGADAADARLLADIEEAVAGVRAETGAAPAPDPRRRRTGAALLALGGAVLLVAGIGGGGVALLAAAGALLALPPPAPPAAGGDGELAAAALEVTLAAVTARRRLPT